VLESWPNFILDRLKHHNWWMMLSNGNRMSKMEGDWDDAVPFGKAYDTVLRLGGQMNLMIKVINVWAILCLSRRHARASNCSDAQ
jgi:hypothetical protein